MQLSNGSFRSAPFHKQPSSITWPRDTSPSTYNSSHSSSKQWAPDVNMLLATSQWLKLHGLKKYKLELKQILSSIGFKHCEEYVAALQKPVKASYSKGLFPQYAYTDGTIYNLLATSEKLGRIESQLKQVIGLYQERLEWLTSASRLVFGVIQEQSVAIIVDLQCSSEAELDLIKNALTSLVKEQLLFVSRFNFIRCAPEIERWHERSVNVSTDSIEGVLTWIHNLKLEEPHEISCTVEALLKAAEDVQVESIYLFTDGSCSVDTREVLKRKLQDLHVPVHIVALNCVSPSCLNFLKETVKISRGRFHKFCLYDNDGGDKTSSKIFARTELSEDFPEHGRLKLEVGVRQDVIALWEELDMARNTLAEIQAIQIHISQREPVVTNPAPFPMEKQENRKARTENELYMSSKEWLKKHSLKSTKLGFYDLLQNVAFRHCDGVVEVPNPRDDSNLATVKSKLVNARYCDKFAHVRWKDGQIFHVHISGDVHRNYERRIMAVLDSYKQRIQWLQKGSRELFGTIIEDQVTILIDTSASMNSRLFLVKDKLYQLLQQQIKHKRKFNLIKFDSRVQAWRSRLVDCNDRNIDDAWQWIKGLVVGGSTNTLGALKLALSDPLCSAIYLLTDGRPDQPPLTILSQIHLQDPVPIHTISFNCSDESANEFLCKLSANTNARFHYFSEHGINEGDPKPFESEDLRLIREEIEKGVNDLQRLTRLRNWCAQLDWYGSNKNKTTSIRAVPRPSSAPLIRRPKKSSGAIFRRARSVKEKKVKIDAVKPETKDVSSKDSSSEDESIHSESVKSEESKLGNLSNEEKEPLLESTNILKETELDSAKVKKKKKKKTTKQKSAPCSTQNDAEERRPIAKIPRQPKTQTNYRGIGNDSVRTNGDVKHKGSLNPSQKAAEGERPRGQWLRNHKVLARNDVDGFYYPGILRTNINSRYADVAFCDFESQIVCLRYIIPNEGARPCPSLKVGDYVLVKTLREGGLPCYVPGVVYVVPLRQSKATKYYTVIHHNGRKTTSLRKDLVKISQSRYTFACRYIKDCEITANKSPSISVFSLEAKKKKKSEKKDVTNSSSDSDDRDKGSDSQDDKLDDNVAKHNKKDSDEHGSSEEDVDSSPKSSINQELERIKQALSETRESQLKSFEEQQDRFDDLRQQLKDAMEDQSRRQEELKNQYDELKESRCKGDGTDEDLQDKQLEEARELLEEQQENMIKDFKKHQKLLEELLHQQAPVKTNNTSLPDDKQKRMRKKKRNKQSPEGRSSSISASGSSSSSSNSPRDSPRVQSPEQPGHLAPKEDVEAPATLQFHVSSSEKEACLWTKGSHGLLISRVPLEEDPAVENRHVPTRLQSGEEVLARWSDDGWYYRGTVHEPAGDNYFVEDSVGNMEEIPRHNIIRDEDDAGNVIQVNDAAVALHPSFPFSYAPGVVVNVEDDLLYTVRFYDGQEDAIPREEVYYLTHEKFSSDVNFIVRCEESLVGQAVVARNDANGLFYLANIRERVGNGRQYVVQWPDGSTQVQSSALIFGAHTKRHQLAMGDRVLALSNAADGLYEPGWITGVSGKKLNVKFSTGKRSSQVDPMQCFWLSSDYYDRIVDYITKNNRK